MVAQLTLATTKSCQKQTDSAQSRSGFFPVYVALYFDIYIDETK